MNEVKYWLQTPYFIPFDKLTVNSDLLSGDDRDCMAAPGADHLVDQTPRSAAGLELQDLIVDAASIRSS